MRLEISNRASRDLRELHEYGMRTYGITRADAYLGEIFAKFDDIGRWPFAARLRFDPQRPARLSRHRAHNILYEVADDTVYVLRVFHHSVDWISRL